MMRCGACGAPNPDGQTTCYACSEPLYVVPTGGQAYPGGQAPAGPTYVDLGLYDQDTTLTVLKRLGAMAAGTRMMLILGSIGYGLMGGGAMFRVMAGMATGDDTTHTIVTLIGAAIGGFIGYWIGKILGDFAVVWIEWAAQMLAASDAIVVGQDHANS